MGETGGVSRSIAQIHALLFVSDMPITSEKTAEKLNIARGDSEMRAPVYVGQLFLDAAGMRLRIPRWLSPGTMRLLPRQEASGRLSFPLTLTHPFFGRHIHPIAFFRDP
jgi:hypothetical protein